VASPLVLGGFSKSALDNKNSVDLTVQTIVEMFQENFLRNTARETGVVEQECKIDVVILFWVTTLGFGVRFLSAIRGLKRKYEEKAKTTLSISSFYDRLTPEMVDFLRKLCASCHCVSSTANWSFFG
jgi:hypothetical protein